LSCLNIKSQFSDLAWRYLPLDTKGQNALP
jgi:hypothetical protein